MTCIVGFATRGKVYIGGDSAAIGGWDLTVRKDQKVFKNGPCIMGFTTSFRMGDLLHYSLSIPERHLDEDVDKWMRTTFIDAVRECLKTGGYATKEKEVEEGGEFLVGYEGRLFAIDKDYQVGESICGYDAVGCGAAYAKGAMAAMLMGRDIISEDMIWIALDIAERNSAGVRAPFTVVSL